MLVGHVATHRTSDAHFDVAWAELPAPVYEPRMIEPLIRPDALKAFDRAAFERDGYWLWSDALTDAGRTRVTETLIGLQSMQDYMIMHTDWSHGIEWASRGLPKPPEDRLSEEWLHDNVIGGSEQLSWYPPEAPGQEAIGHGFLSMPVRQYMADVGLFGTGADQLASSDGWDSQGHVPEFAPLCYSPFLLDLATSHPATMQMLSKLFCGKRFCLDHALLLNRKGGGGPGRHWHAHRYGDGRHELHDEDDDGTPSSLFPSRQCIRTLCYPEGATSIGDGGDGGELGLVPGAHLYQVPYQYSSSKADDAEMERWLAGKIHPMTGEPLRILKLRVPPGSFISFCHHMPHWVGPRRSSAPTRWALLLAYRTPDDQLGAQSSLPRPSSPSHAVEQPQGRWGTVLPKQWLIRAELAISRGEYPPFSAQAMSILGAD